MEIFIRSKKNLVYKDLSKEFLQEIKWQIILKNEE
jgi:hypothetical protein